MPLAGPGGTVRDRPRGRLAPSCARPVSRDEPGEIPSMAIDIGVPAPADEPASARLAALIPSKPPIRLEDGLVEVGWDGDLEAEPTRQEIAPDDPEVEPPGDSEPGEELVEDRYAALQAWAEWSRNRDRSANVATDTGTDATPTATDDQDDPGTQPIEGPRGGASAAPIRAETPHDFAPYSQLFTRLRHPS